MVVGRTDHLPGGAAPNWVSPKQGSGLMARHAVTRSNIRATQLLGGPLIVSNIKRSSTTIQSAPASRAYYSGDFQYLRPGISTKRRMVRTAPNPGTKRAFRTKKKVSFQLALGTKGSVAAQIKQLVTKNTNMSRHVAGVQMRLLSPWLVVPSGSSIVKFMVPRELEH